MLRKSALSIMIHESTASPSTWTKELGEAENKSPSYIFFTVIYENMWLESQTVNESIVESRLQQYPPNKHTHPTVDRERHAGAHRSRLINTQCSI